MAKKASKRSATAPRQEDQPKEARFEFDVFLSHNKADKPRVRKLAERLKAAGVRVWLDEWVVKAGDIIALKVDEGLEQSRVLMLCISPTALASGWVALERSTAIHRDPANAGRRFIPLLLADCELPDTLRRYKYVDFRDEAEGAFAELLTACWPEAGAAPPTAEPAPKKKPQPKQPPEQTEPLAVLERKLTGHTNWVRSVAVSPDGKWAASGSDDTTVKIWDLETGQCRATLEGHTKQVNSVAITPDGKRILSGSDDKSVRVSDAISLRELAKLAGHSESVKSVVVLQDNAHALSGGFDKTLRMWNLVSRSCINTIQCGKDGANEIYSTAINRAGTHALSGHDDGGIRLWNLETGECLATMKGHTARVGSVQFTLDGHYGISGSGSSDTTIKVWNLDTGSCCGTLKGHQEEVHSVAISPDGALIASTGFLDFTLRIWDLKSGACLQVIDEGRPNSFISVAFSPDGKRLIAGVGHSGVQCQIYVYHLTGGRTAPAAEATRRYVNAKVVLLGEGTVGKTSLAHRLIDDEYVIKDRTHGMNVWRLDLPDRSLTLRVEPASQDTRLGESSYEGPPTDNEALLWDLAGQEDYRLIHQLFLDETALALLLVNPQKDDPFGEAGDWLKALQTAARNQDSKREAARLLIFSQIDVGGMKLGSAKIERFCEQYGFNDWLPTSAKTGENCSDQEHEGKPPS